MPGRRLRWTRAGVLKQGRSRYGRMGLLLAALAALVAVPAGGEEGEDTHVPLPLLGPVSQSVANSYWSTRPAQAPPQLSQLSDVRREPPARHRTSCTTEANRDVFNCDVFGLPQNEESMAGCGANDKLALQGTNDSRGLI